VQVRQVPVVVAVGDPQLHYLEKIHIRVGLVSLLYRIPAQYKEEQEVQ
jgi:hypothetical protein